MPLPNDNTVWTLTKNEINCTQLAVLYMLDAPVASPASLLLGSHLPAPALEPTSLHFGKSRLGSHLPVPAPESASLLLGKSRCQYLCSSHLYPTAWPTVLVPGSRLPAPTLKSTYPVPHPPLFYLVSLSCQHLCPGRLFIYYFDHDILCQVYHPWFLVY